MSKFAAENQAILIAYLVNNKTFMIMTNNKLINYNVAERSETEVRIARMIASRHEILSNNGKNRNK